MLDKEEKERFDKVIDEILLPVANEMREEIDIILTNNPELMKKVQSEMNGIMERRKPKKTEIKRDQDTF